MSFQTEIIAFVCIKCFCHQIKGNTLQPIDFKLTVHVDKSAIRSNK